MIQSNYTKLFGSIIASTIWNEDNVTRILWITLLALSDREGYVAGSIPGLATLARVSIEDCKRALEKLQQPDEFSRSPEHEGRRIEVVEGGWFILNRAKYRNLSWEEDKAERRRLNNQRYYRNRKGDEARHSDNSDSNDLNQSESDRVGHKHLQRHCKESIAQTSLAPLPKSPSQNSKPNSPSEGRIEQIYKLYPKKRNKLDGKKAIRKAISLVMAGDCDHPPMGLPEALNYMAQRVRLYADAVRGRDSQFLPYPAKWFNAGSFWDDEQEWRHKQNGGADKLPADYISPSERHALDLASRTGGVQ